ncbi:type II toxin-antitoxin system HicB family antitoxin [Candidatus Poriferisocius sp.]|uniref:type II toxin-antitoxin system HicB family antitoxin n=1 Tax=Candidatus Poriferisocius sp. TaxID=3101276 RepID=UPI003B02ADC3
MIYAYPCDLTPDADGWFVATFPDVPEAVTGGPDRAEAMKMAADALAVALSGYLQSGRDVPPPGTPVEQQELVAVPTVVAAKLALYSAMREQEVTKVELARRLSISEAAVRRLVNPDHRSHIGQVNKALAAVGCSLVVEVVPV